MVCITYTTKQRSNINKSWQNAGWILCIWFLVLVHMINLWGYSESNQYSSNFSNVCHIYHKHIKDSYWGKSVLDEVGWHKCLTQKNEKLYGTVQAIIIYMPIDLICVISSAQSILRNLHCDSVTFALYDRFSGHQLRLMGGSVLAFWSISNRNLQKLFIYTYMDGQV